MRCPQSLFKHRWIICWHLHYLWYSVGWIDWRYVSGSFFFFLLHLLPQKGIVKKGYLLYISRFHSSKAASVPPSGDSSFMLVGTWMLDFVESDMRLVQTFEFRLSCLLPLGFSMFLAQIVLVPSNLCRSISIGFADGEKKYDLCTNKFQLSRLRESGTQKDDLADIWPTFQLGGVYSNRTVV